MTTRPRTVKTGSPRASASVSKAILPARTASPAEVLRAVADALEHGRAVVLATVLKRRGSTPATPGQKLALLGASELVGTVGGGALEQDVVDTLTGQVEAAGQPSLSRADNDCGCSTHASGRGAVHALTSTSTLEGLVIMS